MGRLYSVYNRFTSYALPLNNFLPLSFGSDCPFSRGIPA
nr:MAG TPA: hypothetical protein [Bacteriophage sp.]